jgi:hypothetical protein
VRLPLLAIAVGRPASGGGWLLTAFSVGGLAGLLTGVLTVRQLILGLAGGQLLSAAPLLLAPGPRSLMSNDRVVSAVPTQGR